MNKKQYYNHILNCLRYYGYAESKLGLYQYMQDCTDLLSVAFDNIVTFSDFKQLSWNQIIERLQMRPVPCMTCKISSQPII